jgi:hypothetical protein
LAINKRNIKHCQNNNLNQQPMKSILLLYTLSLTLLSSIANAQINPNAHLGLDEKVISFMCSRAGKLEGIIFYGVENLTPFEEALYSKSGKKQMLYDLSKQSQPLPPESQAEIGKLWNTNYNQIYCPYYSSSDFSGTDLPASYLDMRLLITKQMDVLEKFYGKESPYHFNINRLVIKDPTNKEVNPEWVTFTDLVKELLDDDDLTSSNRETLQKYFTQIRNEWGGKYASELQANNTDEMAATELALLNEKARAEQIEKEQKAQADKIGLFFNNLQKNLLGNKITLSAPGQSGKLMVYIDKFGNAILHSSGFETPIYYFNKDYHYDFFGGEDLVIKYKYSDDDDDGYKLLEFVLMNIYLGDIDDYEATLSDGKATFSQEGISKFILTHNQGKLSKIELGDSENWEDHSTMFVNYEKWSGDLTEYPLNKVANNIRVLEVEGEVFSVDIRVHETFRDKAIASPSTKVIKQSGVNYASRYGQYEWQGNVIKIGATTMKMIKIRGANVSTTTTKDEILADLGSETWEGIFQNRYIEHTQKGTIMRNSPRFARMITYTPSGDLVVFDTTFKKIR